jgi:predicted metal-dependent HD superfamily phosphohydrolase
MHVSPERVEALQTSWVRLAANYACEPIAAYPIFDRLVAAYAEPHRHYHTLEHIAEMLKIVGRLATGQPDVGVVMLAVWFHDVVYDPRARNNESQSANVADEWLAPFVRTNEQHELLRKLILVTDHRTTTTLDPLAMVLLDADLAILAAGESRYARYATAIRQEYAHVSDAEYRLGRANVLQSFLARDTIYHTPTLRIEAEAVARHNLRSELETLLALPPV